MTNEEFLKSITLDGEEWRDVVGYAGLYVVSNFGRVAKMTHSQTWINHGTISTRIYPAHILIPTKIKPRKIKDYGCYLTVKLGPKSNRKLCQVHRLVAEAFLTNDNDYPHIDHIDGNKENNRVENLRYCTPKMNMNNPITKERIRQSNTGNTLIAKNVRIPVASIINGVIHKVYTSMISVKQDGYSPMSVRRCCMGNLDSHKGVRWKFISDLNLNISDVKELYGIGRELNPLPLSDSVDYQQPQPPQELLFPQHPLP